MTTHRQEITLIGEERGWAIRDTEQLALFHNVWFCSYAPTHTRALALYNEQEYSEFSVALQKLPQLSHSCRAILDLAVQIWNPEHTVVLIPHKHCRYAGIQGVATLAITDNGRKYLCTPTAFGEFIEELKIHSRGNPL